VIAFFGWIVLAAAMLESARLTSSGFTVGGLVPELAVLVGLQVLLRASNFATVRPAREALFTVVEREVKYKSKSFIDTFVYRLGDGVGAWTYLGMLGIGAALPAISVAVVPVAAVWIGVGAVLGRRQRALANEL
jgi:AAA family ATP:ADP antiporter